MKHNAHLIEMEGRGALEDAARQAGFRGAIRPGIATLEEIPTVALRLDHLDATRAEAIRSAAITAGLPSILEPDLKASDRQRVLVAGDRSGIAALAAKLQPQDPSLGKQIDRLLEADACREWTWRMRGRELRAGGRPLVMGVINVTPDSFSDGGAYQDTACAVDRGLKMVSAGADLLDVGGESTRPGAARVSIEEECERVLPVIRGLSRQCDVSISIDTSRAAVAREAIQAGARIVNDISGLNFDTEMAAVVAQDHAGLVVMHMQGTPGTMQEAPVYEDIVGEVLMSLRRSLETAEQGGIRPEQVAVDPGIGFGKRLEHNLVLLARLGSFRALGRPILVGVSRKSFLGELTGEPVERRLAASLGAAIGAVERGASIVRVHDAAETVEAIQAYQAVRSGASR